MKRLALVVVALVACKKTPAGSGANSDCDVIKKDPANAMVELSKKYPNNALKVAQTIEDCVAPTGDECDRVAAIVKAIPSMAPGLGAPREGSDFAATCRGAPPEMRKCYLPSYVMEHSAECKKIIDDMRVSIDKPIDVAPACDGGTVVMYVSSEGTWIATGKDPASRCFAARKDNKIDNAWIESELGQYKTKDCRPSVELGAAGDVKYQDVITAMDVAVKVGLTDVGLSPPEELPVPFKDSKAPKGPQHCPATTIASSDAAGSGAGSGSTAAAGHHQAGTRTVPPATGPALKDAEIVIVTKDEIMLHTPGATGSGAESVMKVKDAMTGSGPLKDLARELPASTDGLLIIQADQDTSAIVINRIVVTAKAGGYDNVLFAVKNK